LEGSLHNDDEVGGGTEEEEWNPEDLCSSKSKLDLISKLRMFTPGATKYSSKRKRVEQGMQSSELQIVETAKATGFLSPSTPSQTILQLRDRLRSSSADMSSSSKKKQPTPPEKRR
jgi:hypothetical protein